LVRYERNDTPHRSLQALSRVVHLNVYEYQAFIDQHPHFYVLGKPGWLHQQLSQDGFQVVREKGIGPYIYEVTKTDSSP
jgi:hypothetical protein